MSDLIDRAAAFLVLRKAQIASCTCQIKTPDPDWHHHNCRYRILREIEAMIEHLPDADAIAALPAHGVRVKPLEWSEDGQGGFTAKGAARTYAVHRLALEPGTWGAVGVTVTSSDRQTVMDACDNDNRARILAALAPAEAGGVEEPISDARLECEALCARFLAGEASEKEVVDTIKKVARDNERLAVLASQKKEHMRSETDSEHIARDMREGRFPARSEPQMVPVTPAPVDALVKAAEAYRTATRHLRPCPETAAGLDAALAAIRGEKP